VTIVHRSTEVQGQVLRMAALISEEINVKEVAVLSDESLFTTVSVKPNFKTLGKRAGSKMALIKSTLQEWGTQQVSELEAGKTLQIDDMEITLEDVLLQRSTKGDAAVATNGQLTVVLDTAVTDELRAEGHARELISLVQAARKAAGLEVSDRIVLTWSTQDANLAAAIERHSKTISQEVLASSISTGGGTQAVDINGIPLLFSLTLGPG
jgi:isoleucyl-tRNA synthetase